MTELKNKAVAVTVTDGGSIKIRCGESDFYIENGSGAYYTDTDNKRVSFSEMPFEIKPQGNSVLLENAMFTAEIALSGDEPEVHFSILQNDTQRKLKSVCWPAPVKRVFCDSGKTVLPVMQGMLISDTEGSAHNVMDGLYCSREMTMPWWGQYDRTDGYMAVIDTPWDSQYIYEHSPQESTSVQVCWIPSLGEFAYRRELTIRFYGKPCNYVDFCDRYREELLNAGKFITLADKIKNNPSLSKMIGAPVFNAPLVYYKIEEDSDYYHADDLSKNTGLNTFASVSEGIRRLYGLGIRNAYIHLDGWGFGGYDNLCPRVLPPCPEAGGEKGLKEVIAACKECDFLLAYHDQYRDYYYKSPDYNENDAVMREDGSFSSSEDIVWYGGKESQLCAVRALDYLSRNYREMCNSGLLPDGAYLDVFSASIPDECFNPAHRMTRRECIAARGRCFDFIRSLGMIISSEEVIGEFADKLDLVHHSPYINAFFDFLKIKPFGTNIPLLNLVFHECVLIPWYIGDGVWGLPSGESGFLHCLLNGDSPAVPFETDEKFIRRSELVCRLNREVACSRMLSHSFTGEYKQKTVFEGGISVEIDTQARTYEITWADGSITRGNDSE